MHDGSIPGWRNFGADSVQRKSPSSNQPDPFYPFCEPVEMVMTENGPRQAESDLMKFKRTSNALCAARFLSDQLLTNLKKPEIKFRRDHLDWLLAYLEIEWDSIMESNNRATRNVDDLMERAQENKENQKLVVARLAVTGKD